MTPRDRDARYEDILNAAGYAREIVARGRDEFDRDIVIRLGGERVIELVDEAVAAVVDHLEEEYPDYPGTSRSGCATSSRTSTGAPTLS